METLSRLSVPHFIQHTIDILEDNFNIVDLNVRYPRDRDTILHVIEYIRMYDDGDGDGDGDNDVRLGHDRALYQDLRSMIDLMKNKINLLTRNVRNNKATDGNIGIVELLTGLKQEEFFHISDLCYNHLYKINDAYNDIDTDNWSVTDNLSPNLLSLFDKPSTSDSKATVNFNNWIQPAYHGLENSLPIIIMNKSDDHTADDDDDDDDDGDSSVSYDVESSDDGVIDPDSYVMHSKLSNSLSSLFNTVKEDTTTTTTTTTPISNSQSGVTARPIAAGIKWQAPSTPGLSNSNRKKTIGDDNDDDDDEKNHNHHHHHQPLLYNTIFATF